MGFWDGSGISWTICKQSAPRSRQITTPTPHHAKIFTGRMFFVTRNQQCQSRTRLDKNGRVAHYKALHKSAVFSGHAKVSQPVLNFWPRHGLDLLSSAAPPRSLKSLLQHMNWTEPTTCLSGLSGVSLGYLLKYISYCGAFYLDI